MFLKFNVLQYLVLFDVLEVFIGRDLQLVGGLFVADDDTMLVHLKGRDGPHVVHGPLDGCLQGAGLAMTVHQNHHLTGIHHGANTYGQGVSGYVLGLTAEETGVGYTGVGGQRLHTGSGAQGRAGLVESDVTVRADTTDEQVDAACLLDHLLIVPALGHEVGGITIQDVDVLLRTVDMVEEVTGHEGMVALRMSLGQAHVLVHVEGNYILKGYLSGTVGLDKGIVHANG